VSGHARPRRGRAGQRVGAGQGSSRADEFGAGPTPNSLAARWRSSRAPSSARRPGAHHRRRRPESDSRATLSTPTPDAVRINRWRRSPPFSKRATYDSRHSPLRRSHRVWPTRRHAGTSARGSPSRARVSRRSRPTSRQSIGMAHGRRRQRLEALVRAETVVLLGLSSCWMHPERGAALVDRCSSRRASFSAARVPSIGARPSSHPSWPACQPPGTRSRTTKRRTRSVRR
jgi:hypothetical protein